MKDETGVDAGYTVWFDANKTDILEQWKETLDVEDLPDEQIGFFLENEPKCTTSECLSDGCIEGIFDEWCDGLDFEDVPDEFVDKAYEKWMIDEYENR